jgi:hypothetical protein
MLCIWLMWLTMTGGDLMELKVTIKVILQLTSTINSKIQNFFRRLHHKIDLLPTFYTYIHCFSQVTNNQDKIINWYLLLIYLKDNFFVISSEILIKVNAYTSDDTYVIHIWLLPSEKGN